MRLNLYAIAIVTALVGFGCEAGDRKANGEPVKKVEDCKHDEKSFRCVKYLRNYDADTITFNIPGVHALLGNEIAIRVNGIDTPELRTKKECEKQAGYRAKEIVKVIMEKGKRIDLINIDRGKYFRIVADVIVDGQDLKQALLKEKLAYEYDCLTKSVVDWCKVSKPEPAKK